MAFLIILVFSWVFAAWKILGNLLSIHHHKNQFNEKNSPAFDGCLGFGFLFFLRSSNPFYCRYHLDCSNRSKVRCSRIRIYLDRRGLVLEWQKLFLARWLLVKSAQWIPVETWFMEKKARRIPMEAGSLEIAMVQVFIVGYDSIGSLLPRIFSRSSL